MATLIFEITWSPLIEAELFSLTDNGHEMLAAPHRDDDGRITLQWESDHLVPHTIAWDLFAVGQDLSDLKAIACWEHGDIKELGSKDSATNRWQGNGILRRKKVTP